MNMTFMEAMEKLKARDATFAEESEKAKIEYGDADIFQLNYGRFAHRKSWNSPTKSIVSTALFKNDDYRWNEDENHQRKEKLDYILTGVKLGEYDAYEPTDEDMFADDWEVADVSADGVNLVE
jgi:hypothetical protein